MHSTSWLMQSELNSIWGDVLFTNALFGHFLFTYGFQLCGFISFVCVLVFLVLFSFVFPSVLLFVLFWFKFCYWFVCSLRVRKGWSCMGGEVSRISEETI